MFVPAPFSAVVQDIFVQDGDSVKEGQKLAQMDIRREERALADARKTLSEALQRLDAPDSQGHAEKELAPLADKVGEAEERMAQGTVSAPFAGRITELRAQRGQYLKQGDALLEIAEQGALEIYATVPSTWARHLESGHIIWVYVEETARSYEAVIARLGGKVDPATRSIRAYARFTGESAGILPGMSGRANFWPPLKD
ncbi:HlyD family efflux transporter periplasmic adaptor subunit, partial [Desulfovibrio sp. OttesenSCG-928-A18]|nr:HlyD family efflux transporter periplasmic adaptor subunit [Desulfovibrio sp. OttesenSCG-928-A18]